MAGVRPEQLAALVLAADRLNRAHTYMMEQRGPDGVREWDCGRRVDLPTAPAFERAAPARDSFQVWMWAHPLQWPPAAPRRQPWRRGWYEAKLAENVARVALVFERRRAVLPEEVARLVLRFLVSGPGAAYPACRSCRGQNVDSWSCPPAKCLAFDEYLEPAPVLWANPIRPDPLLNLVRPAPPLGPVPGGVVAAALAASAAAADRTRADRRARKSAAAAGRSGRRR